METEKWVQVEITPLPELLGAYSTCRSSNYLGTDFHYHSSQQPATQISRIADRPFCSCCGEMLSVGWVLTSSSIGLDKIRDKWFQTLTAALFVTPQGWSLFYEPHLVTESNLFCSVAHIKVFVALKLLMKLEILLIDTHLCNRLTRSSAWLIWSSEQQSKNNSLIWCVLLVLSDLFSFNNYWSKLNFRTITHK